MTAADVNDYRLLARKRLPRFLFDYIDGGSYSESTLRANVADLSELHLRQRVMHDVSDIDLSTELFGEPAAMPVALAPIGLAGLYARRGEVQAARAAHAAGVPFVLSTMSCCSLEEVTRETPTPPLLQLYIIKDRGFMADLLDRARHAGVSKLVLTVDLIMHSARYRDIRSGLTGPQNLPAKVRRLLSICRHPAWAWDVGVRGRPHILGNVAPAMPDGAGLAQFTDWVGGNFDPSITWKDLEWLRSRWDGDIILKGLLDPQDVHVAAGEGFQGLIISNHGGRQLDGAVSSIRALPKAVDAAAGRIPIFMDGGVRTGVDVLKALALGAQGVLIGRAWALALGARGEAGVAHVLDLLRHELHVAMALTGQTSVRGVTSAVLDG